MKKIIISFSFLLCLFSVSAQNYLGVLNSNYAGVMGTDLQPASFVDGRYKFDLNLFSMNFSAYQNLGYFDANAMRAAEGGKGYWWKKSFGDTAIFNNWAQPDSTFMDRFIKRRYDQNSNGSLGFNTNLQIDLFNFMFHVSPKVAIGFGAKVRTITNIDNLDPKLAVLAEEGLDYPDLWNIKLNEELLNINHLTWAEYGFNYSQVVMDKKEHFLKAGGKIKYLAGYSAAYLYTNNFAYDLKNEDTSQYLAGDFAYGYSSNLDDITSGNSTGMPKQQSKFGLGFDLGVVYEWRPNWEKYKYDMDGKTNLWMRNKNKYKARVGVSILDIGGMRFTKGGLSRDFSVNTSNLFDLNRFEAATSFLNFDKVIDSLVNESNAAGNNDWSTNEKTSDSFYMRTPTAISFQADYHIWKCFYVNATGMFNMISRKTSTKVKVPNQISITPSVDFAYFGLHFPISMNTYSGFKVGAATRLGPLTLGFTDFRTLMAKGQIRGAEFFMGLRLPILYHAVKDKDKDKVSNKKDDCKTIPGTWEFKGCPDTDGDGIKDTEDDCATIPGIAEFKGCPDKDGDKVPDKDDDCPEIAGLKEFKGCPDKDGDKIIDKNDDCPEVAGVAEFKGCPDTDKDGIKDSEDACPQLAGIKEFKGCPDKDGDGLSDSEDGCPEIAGPKDNKGCPYTDKDGDGVMDNEDACPNEKGLRENKGCPITDSDNDGLLDKDDDCPTLKGPKENKGCPYADTDKDGLLDKEDACPTIKGPKDNKGCPFSDSDNDGVFDKEDECPQTPGPVSNKGCPIIDKEDANTLKTAYNNLEFATGKSIILNDSKAALNELAETLKKKPNWNLEITGHTDNVGEEATNLELSKKRAEALKNYLVSKGIDANRLKVLYVGETQPIGDNNTADGRGKNRRVEMKIVFE
jgi:outer membrane protein OmpA-like peptidoglycan-associated protein